jgi:arabinan endo-1,5-alpha-L-arabinosidase
MNSVQLSQDLRGVRPFVTAALKSITASFLLRHVYRVMLLLLAAFSFHGSFALQGNDNCHDPSTIIKNGNRYWIFTTGQGIYAMYSTDLINWQSGSRTVFPIGTWPGWINTYAPNFAGDFWAPEIIFMNNKYYLYYSCTSAFGSKQSVIGLATNVTLDPNSPSYNWVDEGMVVASSNSSDFNAIDAALVRDASGRLWMSYGSFANGLRIMELSTTTGKPLSSSSTRIAGNGGGNSGSEAPYIVRNGSYYYLFINKGACCNGASSTYYIQVGRSTSPTGPYLDKNGVSMLNNGGTTILATQGNYVGPGHVGLFQENGFNYLSHHYYDANQNGRARLSIGNLGWDNSGWPFITRDWIAQGRYTVTNVNSGKVWDAWGCTGAQGQAVAQGNSAGLNCQQWDFTPVGNGEYRITCALGGRAVDASGCSANNGTLLQLWAYSGANCQKWKVERASGGSIVFSSVNGNRVIEVPNAATTAGVQLALWDYNGNNGQKWTVGAPGARLTMAEEAGMENVRIYPVPASKGSFFVDMGKTTTEENILVEIFSAKGHSVYRQTIQREGPFSVEAALQPGVYVVQIRKRTGVQIRKILVD